MSTAISVVVTDAGLAAGVAAGTNGTTIKFTHLAIGSQAWDPDASATAMHARKEVVAVTGGTKNGRTFQLYGTFKGGAYTGSDYLICEIGAYIGHPDQGGVLAAVVSSSSHSMGVRGAAVYTDFAVTLSFTMDGEGAENITVEVDESGAIAEALIAAHEAKTNPHAQYVRHDAAQGLSDSHKAMARSNIAFDDRASALAAAALATHVAAADPHTQYLKESDAADALYAGAAVAEVLSAAGLTNADPNRLRVAIFDLIHPVGSIIHRYDTNNPGGFYTGTTWTLIGQGRVLIGLNSSDTSFDAIGETGGAKTHTLTVDEMPAHSHTSNSVTSPGTKLLANVEGEADSLDLSVTNNTTASAGGGQAFSILPPYLVVAIWRRTA